MKAPQLLAHTRKTPEMITGHGDAWASGADVAIWPDTLRLNPYEIQEPEKRCEPGFVERRELPSPIPGKTVFEYRFRQEL